MNKKLMLDLLALHVVGIGAILFGDAIEPQWISYFLIAEIGWLALFVYLIVQSKTRWLLMIISLPIFWLVEKQLMLVVAMGGPYSIDRLFGKSTG